MAVPSTIRRFVLQDPSLERHRRFQRQKDRTRRRQERKGTRGGQLKNLFYLVSWVIRKREAAASCSAMSYGLGRVGLGIW